MLRLIMGALLMACCVVGTAYAVDIYQWKDVSGIMHFTDNEMNVPVKYRETAKRKVRKLKVLDKDMGDKPKGLEATVWFDKCASCHTTGKNKGDKFGLGVLTINQQTKFPATIDEITSQLRWAANGRISDMPSLDVTDEQLKQIAAFIFGVK